MLELKNIVKDYPASGEAVHALRGISLQFRESEFVSILGPSGCGKTTMLNIIGGLDQYTSGDLVINGRSTTNFRDRDWDAYRNHSIGFVFQSYNLIPHQSVLRNVELALTLSGVSRSERRRRARKALEDVGLGDQLGKKPSEMSGGQMQRVAIARAIVNDPDIILADEPTGALDTETSVQVMDILKNISSDRLVIMVTHNPELAMQYSTRVIRMLDGRITDDSAPLTEQEVNECRGHDRAALEEQKGRQQKLPAMSLFTAFGLSLNNLFTKKGRTALTSFAGSIGIIGIALIYAVSQGTNDYIDTVQEDTLSSYPLTIMSETADLTSMVAGMSAAFDNGEKEEGTVVEQRMVSEMLAQIGTNDLHSFKSYLEDNMDEVDQDINAIQYSYSVTPQIYTVNVNNELLQVNPSSLFTSMMAGSMSSVYMSGGLFNEMLTNRELLDSQYEVIAGRWPEKYDELVLVLSNRDGLSDYMAYTLGLRDSQELKDMIEKVMNGEEVEVTSEPLVWTYDDLLSLEMRLVNSTDYYKYNSEYKVWEDMRDDEDYMDGLYDGGEKLHIAGIVCPQKGVSASALSPGFAYLPELTEHIVSRSKGSGIVAAQLEDMDTDVFSGKTFEELKENDNGGIDFGDMISVDTDMLSDAFGMNISQDAIEKSMLEYMDQISSSISANSAPAQAAFTDTLSDFFSGTLRSLIAAKGAGGVAMITKADAYTATAGYLATDEAKAKLAALEGKYLIQADKLAEMYNSLISGMISAYIDATAALMPTPPSGDVSGGDVPPVSVPLRESDIDTIFSNLISSAKVAESISSIAQGMTEAVMKKEILTSFSSSNMELMGLIADGFNVDQNKIAAAFDFDLSEDELTRLMNAMTRGNTEVTADGNLRSLGYADLDEPTAIMIYLIDFDAKEHFIDFIAGYNDSMTESGREEQVINYTDITGALMSSITTIINAITYVLIAFVAISLIVSSIMIGVITLISVQERTKEIGILRAIGASKKNVSSMFNAETVLIGFSSGLLGVLITYLLCIPINIILHSLTGLNNLSAQLPVSVAVILVLISMALTLIAGVIPSKSAAKKDPVVALRTE